MNYARIMLAKVLALTARVAEIKYTSELLLDIIFIICLLENRCLFLYFMLRELTYWHVCLFSAQGTDRILYFNTSYTKVIEIKKVKTTIPFAMEIQMHTAGPACMSCSLIWPCDRYLWPSLCKVGNKLQGQVSYFLHLTGINSTSNLWLKMITCNNTFFSVKSILL